MDDEPKKSKIKPMDTKDKVIAAFVMSGLVIVTIVMVWSTWSTGN